MCISKLVTLFYVFIHSSIKTRIETDNLKVLAGIDLGFLYIVPLKQGLKPIGVFRAISSENMFLYIVPLKQGLKLKFSNTIRILERSFYT